MLRDNPIDPTLTVLDVKLDNSLSRFETSVEQPSQRFVVTVQDSICVLERTAGWILPLEVHRWIDIERVVVTRSLAPAKCSDTRARCRIHGRRRF